MRDKTIAEILVDTRIKKAQFPVRQVIVEQYPIIEDAVANDAIYTEVEVLNRLLA